MIRLEPPEPGKKYPNQKSEPPSEQVVSMRREGFNDKQIKEYLEGQNFNSTQISEALNQAGMKTGASNTDYGQGMQQTPESQNYGQQPPVYEGPQTQGMQISAMNQPQQQKREPSYPQEHSQEYPQVIQQPVYEGYQRGPEEDIEEIAEQIIDEKWQRFIESAGNINIWKDRVNTDIISIKQEIIRMENRLENLQKAILRKIEDYDKGISTVGTEIKALEKVFQKIITPLTSNIKQLDKITKELKKR